MSSVAQSADVLGRLLARREGRAVPCRASRQLADDPPVGAFGIATIKMVSEELLQAVAFGCVEVRDGTPNGRPDVVVRWNPLSRETDGLDLLAAALDRYIADCATAGEAPRVWLPHAGALTAIELLGHRYRTNRAASPELRLLGSRCLALAEEACFDGQQAVAVAADVLRKHVLTGQSPVEDGHLGALLAWVSPLPDRRPEDVAFDRALVPASGVLTRQDDDRVEALRRVAKGEGRAARAARAQVEAILQRAALAEWQLLLAARQAVLELPLPVPAQLRVLVEASRERLAFALAGDRAPASRPAALADLFAEREHAIDLAEEVAVKSDPLARERARSKGRLITATVAGVRWGNRPGFKPCAIAVRTDQGVVRVRRGSKLKTLDGELDVEVAAEGEDGGARLLDLNVTRGVRAVRAWVPGRPVELTDAGSLDLGFLRSKARRAMEVANSPLVFADELPAAARPVPAPVDLLDRANRLRQSAR